MGLAPQGVRPSVDRGKCGPSIEPRNRLNLGRRRRCQARKAISPQSTLRKTVGAPRGHRPRARTDTLCTEPGRSGGSPDRWLSGARWEARGRNPPMNGYRKSEGPIVPRKSPNNSRWAEEGTEERGPAKGSPLEQNMRRTQSRVSMKSALERIRQASKARRQTRRWEPDALAAPVRF